MVYSIKNPLLPEANFITDFFDKVHKTEAIPAVTHADYSTRIQTVHKDTNEKYYKLIQKFKNKTNCQFL